MWSKWIWNNDDFLECLPTWKQWVRDSKKWITKHWPDNFYRLRNLLFTPSEIVILKKIQIDFILNI